MISVQSTVDSMLARLDAEGSDRYLFDQDLKPAINSAITWLIAVFNAAFSDKKLSEENLQDLVKVKIWQANGFSRINYDSTEVGHDLWTILGIFPNPTVEPVTTPPTLADNKLSVYRNDLTFVDSPYSAKRLTLEQWNQSKDNVFMAGNTSITSGGLESYSYLNFIDASSSGYNNGKEITIRPDVSAKFVAMAYLKVPTPVSVIGDNVEFPINLSDLLVQKALNFIAYKQGDQTNLYAITERDVTRLVQIMS